MASLSSHNSAPNVPPILIQQLFHIVGFACLVAFVINLLILAVPPSLGSPAWRLSVFQQLGDRSVILLFGVALLIYGSGGRRFLKRLSLFAFLSGALLILSCGLVAVDGLTLQQDAKSRISAQVAQIGDRIDTVKADPKLKERLTEDQFQKASELLNSRAETAKQNASSGLIKAGILVISNLFIVGVALVGLGRLSASLAKN